MILGQKKAKRSQIYLPVSLITWLIMKSSMIFLIIIFLPSLQFLCSMGVNKLSHPFILSWWTIQKCMTTSEWDENVSPIQQSILRTDLNKNLEVIEKDYHRIKELPHPVREVINGKAGKAVALFNFSDMLTLSQPGGQIMPTS